MGLVRSSSFSSSSFLSQLSCFLWILSLCYLLCSRTVLKNPSDTFTAQRATQTTRRDACGSLIPRQRTMKRREAHSLGVYLWMSDLSCPRIPALCCFSMFNLLTFFLWPCRAAPCPASLPSHCPPPHHVLRNPRGFLNCYASWFCPPKHTHSLLVQLSISVT